MTYPKSRSWIRLAALAAVIGVLATLIWSRIEPSYNGRSLSEWLAMQNDYPRESAEAMRAMGKRAIPFLLRWSDYKYPAWKRQVVTFYRRHPTWIGKSHARQFEPDALVNRTHLAAVGFVMLGTDAKGGVPQLAKIARTSTNSFAAAWASTSLSFLGEDAIGPLTGIALSPATPMANRMNAVYALHHLTYLGTNAAPCLPALVECCRGTNHLLSQAAWYSLEFFKRSEPFPIAGVKWTNAAPDPALRECVQRAFDDAGVSYLSGGATTQTGRQTTFP